MKGLWRINHLQQCKVYGRILIYDFSPERLSLGQIWITARLKKNKRASVAVYHVPIGEHVSTEVHYCTCPQTFWIKIVLLIYAPHYHRYNCGRNSLENRLSLCPSGQYRITVLSNCTCFCTVGKKKLLHARHFRVWGLTTS